MSRPVCASQRKGVDNLPKTTVPSESTEEWECLQPEADTAKTEKYKKRVGKDKAKGSQDMNIEVNHEELATRRALLQRELRRIQELETQSKQAESEEEAT